MKTCERVKIQFHVFQTSALIGSEQSDLCLYFLLLSRDKHSREALDRTIGKRMIPLSTGNGNPLIQPIDNHYTD